MGEFSGKKRKKTVINITESHKIKITITKNQIQLKFRKKFSCNKPDNTFIL